MIKLAIHKNVYKLEIYKADKKDTKKELREGKLKSFKGLVIRHQRWGMVGY